MPNESGLLGSAPPFDPFQTVTLTPPPVRGRPRQPVEYQGPGLWETLASLAGLGIGAAGGALGPPLLGLANLMGQRRERQQAIGQQRYLASLLEGTPFGEVATRLAGAGQLDPNMVFRILAQQAEHTREERIGERLAKPFQEIVEGVERQTTEAGERGLFDVSATPPSASAQRQARLAKAAIPYAQTGRLGEFSAVSGIVDPERSRMEEILTQPELSTLIEHGSPQQLSALSVRLLPESPKLSALLMDISKERQSGRHIEALDEIRKLHEQSLGRYHDALLQEKEAGRLSREEAARREFDLKQEKWRVQSSLWRAQTNRLDALVTQARAASPNVQHRLRALALEQRGLQQRFALLSDPLRRMTTGMTPEAQEAELVQLNARLSEIQSELSAMERSLPEPAPGAPGPQTPRPSSRPSNLEKYFKPSRVPGAVGG